MAIYNYLWVVNRLCEKLNEVPLDNTTFATADGVYADFKSSVNAAISDIFEEEDNNWPFALTDATFDTIIGTADGYTLPANADSADWDSFYIDMPLLVTSIIQVGGTATATTTTNHLLQTNDQVIISGANQSGYNGTFAATVITPTTFTFQVVSTTVSPATGIITSVGPITPKKLIPIDMDTYRDDEQYMVSDRAAYKTGMYGKPRVIVRTKNNKIIFSPKPDRQYRINYSYYSLPSDLVNWNDIPVIPEKFKEVLVKVAMYYAYMFRDNADEAALEQTDYKDYINKMRRILIPQPTFFRIVD